MLALRFKWCKSNASMYYFINKETREYNIARLPALNQLYKKAI